MQMFDYIIGFIFEELTFSLNDLLFRGGSGDRGSGNEVNPQSWTQPLLFICEEEH